MFWTDIARFQWNIFEILPQYYGAMWERSQSFDPGEHCLFSVDKAKNDLSIWWKNQTAGFRSVQKLVGSLALYNVALHCSSH